MAKLMNVFCTYSGGGTYIVTAQLDESTWFTCDLDLYGTYDVPYFDIEEKYDCDYASHWKDVPSDQLPTWKEVLDAVTDSYKNGASKNMDLAEVRAILWEYHPCITCRVDGTLPDPAPLDPHTERLETLACIIEVFEDFLEEKGIDIPNPERDEDPCGSLIYGTDYGNLSDALESLLIRLGYMKEEE